MRGYRPLDVVYSSRIVVQQFDCGTCPVTLACALNKGGTGYTFPCCGSTGFETTDDDGEPVVLIIDCAQHHFERNAGSAALPACPLCSGEIVDHVLLNMTDPCLWVPTVHSKIGVETRRAQWSRVLPAAQQRAADIAKRKAPR